MHAGYCLPAFVPCHALGGPSAMRMMSNFWMSNWATIHAFLGRYQAIQGGIELKPNWLLASSSFRFVKFSRVIEHSSHSAHIGVPHSIHFLISFVGETQAVYTTSVVRTVVEFGPSEGYDACLWLRGLLGRSRISSSKWCLCVLIEWWRYALSDLSGLSHTSR